MKNVIAWVKHNPIAVIAIFLCVASLVTLMVIRVQAATFMQSMRDRDKVVKQLQRLKVTRVKIPAPDLDNPVTEKDVTVNEAAIHALQEVYKAMGAEYTNIFSLAVDHNRKGHAPILDGLFPDPGDEKDKLYDARDAYLAAFDEMLLYYTPNSFYPRLDAGPPTQITKLQEIALAEQEDYLNRDLEPRSVGDLTPTEAKELKELQQAAVLDAIKKDAAKIHIYAPTAEEVFQIGEWSRPGRQPSLSQIWRGQMELWVQQDIVGAIGLANRVSDSQSNVMNNPVKQLLQIQVIPGYVGIDSTGGLSSTGTMSSGKAPSGEARLPSDFRLSPTGRRSNTIYDVIHAKVDMIIDFQRIPEVFEAFGKTNFMTILSTTIENIDEYAMLQEGYLLGQGDCVKVTVLLETLWLREWTTRLMPERVRKQLFIEEPEEQEDQ